MKPVYLLEGDERKSIQPLIGVLLKALDGKDLEGAERVELLIPFVNGASISLSVRKFQANADGEHRCDQPDCFYVADDPRKLGSHKWKAHQIPGKFYAKRKPKRR